ncbi:MAG TPA: histidine phosphatase family protein [Pseudolysinimonas sp.]|nr:histidine phosphatase family protein [Pseudolysinimonas sp.]
MRLLLIRHGQTPANVRGELATARPGPGLTELGIQQAAGVVHALTGERIDAVYASPLLRTALTAAPLAEAHGLTVQVMEGLEEIEAGTLEDRSDMPSVMTYVKTAFGWTEGALDGRIPGSIDGHEFFARFDGAVSTIFDAHPDGTVAAFSHGAAIRVWAVTRGANLRAEAPFIRHLDNTGVVVVTGSPTAGWSVETWEGEPVGGEELADPHAPDPTGDAES